MLVAIRGKHTKKVLWVIAVVVIVAFVLSGARSFLDKRKVKAIAEINGQTVVISNFKSYVDLARLDFILYSNLNKQDRKITIEEIIEKASIYYRLLWKAQEKGIEVSDKEVMEWINHNFSRSGKFSRESYQQYVRHISRNFGLTLTMRSFEEHVRNLILINKLWEDSLDVSVTDNEVETLYAMENQKAKIAYLFIPYEKFRVDVGIKPNEIEEFYRDNTVLFKREPTVNIAYALITEKDKMSPEEITELAKLKTLDQLKEKTSLEIKKTGLIKRADLIKEVEVTQEIAQLAFSLGLNQISPPIDLGENFIIVGKEDEQPAFIPSLGEIKPEVKEALIVSRAREETNRFSSDLLIEINQEETKNLKTFANKNNLEFKQTDFFKYFDYIDGLGLNNQVSAIVFSLAKDEVHSKVIALDKGAYILQLKDKTPIDRSDLQNKKEEYYNKIEERKLFIERLKFITKLNQEIIIKIPSVK